MNYRTNPGTGSTRTRTASTNSFDLDEVKSDADSTIPETTRVKRLASNVGKLLEVEPGESVPTTEVIKQAKVNCYDNPERVVRDDVGSVGSITVPSEENLFGELWEPTPTESEAGLPPSDDPTDSDSGSDSVSESVESFRDWLQERFESEQLSHTYARKTANRRYARASDVDRRFAQRYETFSTVLITYARPRQDGESIVDHAESFYPRSVVSKRRRILKANDCYDGYAGVCVLAPKYRERPRDGHTQSPQTEPEPETHAHTFLWLPGKIDGSTFDFSRVTAPETDVHVSVRHHTGGSNPGTQTGRQPTTALPKELGNNLPVLGADLDARGLAPYAERWCAKLRHGSDGSLETSGIRRWQTLGNFDKLADEQRHLRRLRDGRQCGHRLSESVRVE